MRKLYRMATAATAGTAVAAVALAGCGSSGSSSAADSSGSGSSGSGGAINVLALVAKSGPGHEYGQQELLGIKAAAAYYNSRGGINGHTVKVTSANTNGDPSTATSEAVKKLGSHPGKYQMVYPGSEGSVIAALVPIMKRYKAYSIALDDGNGSCSDVSKCPTEFSLNGDPANPEIKTARWMKKHGHDTVGILEEKVDFAQTETKPIQHALDKQGVRHDIAAFPSSATSVSAQMDKLQSAGARAVFAEVLGAPAGYTLKARKQLGWDVPVVFDIAGSSLDISKLAPRDQLADAYQTVPYCADVSQDVPGFEKLRKFAPKKLDGSVPCNLSGNGWDSVVLLANAVRQAKSTESADLVKATENLPPKAISDPDYITYPKREYTPKNHQDVGQTPGMFKILPVGPIKGTRLHPLS
jgi:ABC-type branched-subunit amino acid transport system substrate-binding protein